MTNNEKALASLKALKECKSDNINELLEKHYYIIEDAMIEAIKKENTP